MLLPQLFAAVRGQRLGWLDWGDPAQSGALTAGQGVEEHVTGQISTVETPHIVLI